jgi:hypothetical protein
VKIVISGISVLAVTVAIGLSLFGIYSILCKNKKIKENFSSSIVIFLTWTFIFSVLIMLNSVMKEDVSLLYDPWEIVKFGVISIISFGLVCVIIYYEIEDEFTKNNKKTLLGALLLLWIFGGILIPWYKACSEHDLSVFFIWMWAYTFSFYAGIWSFVIAIWGGYKIYKLKEKTSMGTFLGFISGIMLFGLMFVASLHVLDFVPGAKEKADILMNEMENSHD